MFSPMYCARVGGWPIIEIVQIDTDVYYTLIIVIIIIWARDRVTTAMTVTTIPAANAHNIICAQLFCFSFIFVVSEEQYDTRRYSAPSRMSVGIYQHINVHACEASFEWIIS